MYIIIIEFLLFRCRCLSHETSLVTGVEERWLYSQPRPSQRLGRKTKKVHCLFFSCCYMDVIVLVLGFQQEKPKDGQSTGGALTTTPSSKKHPLQNKWALWFFKNDKTKSWKDNLRLVTSFDTVSFCPPFGLV